MDPVRTEFSNHTYYGPPNTGIGDLPCERLQPGVIKAVWKPTDIERAMIASGHNIVVILHGEPIPPIAMETTGERLV